MNLNELDRKPNIYSIKNKCLSIYIRLIYDLDSPNNTFFAVLINQHWLLVIALHGHQARTIHMRKAIIIGAGPAGLTAAYELLKRTDIKPIILERSGDIGGISKTVRYKGNGIDIGGHRFFSKSDRVMEWWLNIMQIEEGSNVDISYQNKTRTITGQTKKKEGGNDLIMLVRNRLSRIYYKRKFFDYPLSLSLQTLTNLGLMPVVRIMFSYTWARLTNHKKEKSLEDFFIKRFGKELYRTFFKDYTEKVWGKDCNEISAEWGHQRIKKLSISTALRHAAKRVAKKGSRDISQKNTETSLIEKFLYPKFGPGQLWEEVARQVREMGGEIRMDFPIDKVLIKGKEVTGLQGRDHKTGSMECYSGDFYFSTMPVKDFIAAITENIPQKVAEVAAGLEYRDFITVGLLLDKLVADGLKSGTIKDNWIYIQERDVKIGRLQIFNNWSPYLVADPTKIWIGLEYFCNLGDALWEMDDGAFTSFAINELEKINIIKRSDVVDSVLIRMEKTYPAYFGTYKDFHVIKEYANTFGNLFLIGRNGMHKYNNADHSMLTAMTAVDNIINHVVSKDNIWEINTEQEYHENK